MAKEKKAARKAWEVDFVHVDLDKAQKLEVREYDITGEKTLDLLSRLTLEGYKFSVIYDRGNDATICSITSPKSEDGERSWCLSARAPDMLSAMRVLAYKIIVILDGDLEHLRDDGAVKDSWG